MKFEPMILRFTDISTIVCFHEAYFFRAKYFECVGFGLQIIVYKNNVGTFTRLSFFNNNSII